MAPSDALSAMGAEWHGVAGTPRTAHYRPRAPRGVAVPSLHVAQSAQQRTNSVFQGPDHASLGGFGAPVRPMSRRFGPGWHLRGSPATAAAGRVASRGSAGLPR